MFAYCLEKKLIEVFKNNRHRYLDEKTLLKKIGLAEELNVDTESDQDLERTIDILRLQGYEIDGDLTRGWILISLPDSLNYFELESALKTTFLGKFLFTYRIIGSTNATAKMLAETGAPDGSLLVAEEQRQGKGRFGSSWHSPAGGGIWASLILRPGIKPAQLGSLVLLAALSICLAIEERTGFKPRIKWPNDLYLNDRKLGGVLCEADWVSSELKYVILGFGVNVNIKRFPAKLENSATSLLLAGRGKKVYRIGLLAEIMDRLEEGYFQFLADGFASFLPRVQVRDYLRNRTVKIELDNSETVGGIARGIDERGALLLETPGGQRFVKITQGRLLHWKGSEIQTE
jgi:BirA family biotin operon repressor/biotin-[acetyl-CoA-carboxylase] ligase